MLVGPTALPLRPPSYARSAPPPYRKPTGTTGDPTPIRIGYYDWIEAIPGISANAGEFWGTGNDRCDGSITPLPRALEGPTIITRAMAA